MLVDLVAQGKLDKEIAWAMHVSRRTVRTHLERLYERFGVRCKAALVAAVLTEQSVFPVVQPIGDLLPDGGAPLVLVDQLLRAQSDSTHTVAKRVPAPKRRRALIECSA